MESKENPPVPEKETSQGKTNKSKTSFYSRVVDEAAQMGLQEARDITGIDDEIALLRVKIQSILEHDPENVRLIVTATNSLARLVSIRYKLEANNGKRLKEAIGNVLRDVAVPLGIKYIETKIK
jgi:hypothetical protein